MLRTLLLVVILLGSFTAASADEAGSNLNPLSFLQGFAVTQPPDGLGVQHTKEAIELRRVIRELLRDSQDMLASLPCEGDP